MSEVSPEAPRRKSKLSFPIVFLGVLLAVMVVGYVFGPDRSQDPQARLQCVDRLQQLAQGLALYAEAHGGHWPDPRNWCDSLIEEFDEEGDFQRIFRCPLGGEGRCHYAMNPDADPRGPADLVLLFESQPGWNQHGGAELLKSDRHQGANVLLASGVVMFVTPETAGELEWKAEPNQPAEMPSLGQL